MPLASLLAHDPGPPVLGLLALLLLRVRRRTTKLMPNPTLTQHSDETRQMLYIVGFATLSSVAHIGRLLYENKPVPLKKAIGGAILTLCVGGAGGALCVSYWDLPASVVAAAALVTGFIGGPVVLSILAKIGEMALEKRANGLGEKNP